MFNCPRCGATTTSGIYCQPCNDLLQAELDASDLLDFAMQWCIDHFRVKAGLQPYVKAHLAETPPQGAETYQVTVFVPELAHEVLLAVGEEADGFSVMTWIIEEST
jgi:hypothetical protein